MANADDKDIAWITFNPPEQKRTYHFPSGAEYTFTNVKRIEVRASGKHRVETVDGRKAFVGAGWEMLEIVTDAWTA